MTGEHRTARLGVRVAAGHLRVALALAWRAAGPTMTARIALAVVAGTVPVAAAWLTKLVLDGLAAPARTSATELLVLVFGLVAAGVVGALLPQLARYLDAELNRAVGLSARQRLYAALDRLAGLARFENPHFQDRLQLAVNSGTGASAQLPATGLSIAQGVLTIAGFLATLTLLAPAMIAVVVLAAVPTMRAELVLGRRRARMMLDISHATRRDVFYSGLLISTVAAQEVRLYGLGGLFGSRMVAELRTINAENRRMDRRELVAQALLGFLGALVAGAGLVWAVLAALQGRISLGDVSVFIAAVAGVQAGLSTVISGVGLGHQALLQFDHYRHVSEAEPDLRPPRAGVTRAVPDLRHGIELRDVWFRYGEDLPWVLRDVCLTIPAGQATALVGLNGSGKTTVVKLLCRLYDPTRGAVLWDGTDVREFAPEELRRRIGAVFQEFMHYDLSAAENIGIGDVAAFDDRDRILAAAGRAGADEFVAKLPRGYDTLLSRIYFGPSEDAAAGVVLSGGQWQRLALARALMRDHSDLLILDEPSSGLDAEAEYEVHTRLRKHREGRTSLLISHRLSTIRDADSIVVLADGTTAEHGSHEELLAREDGRYARLFGLQAAGYQSMTDL